MLKWIKENANTIAAVSSAIATIGTVVVAIFVYGGQKRMTQRQLIVPLWDYIAHLRPIHDIEDNLIAAQVVQNANALELVAICCEGGMVDSKVILRAFRKQFMQHFEAIDKVTSPIPGIGKTGQELLLENHPAVVQFYEQLLEDRLNKDKL